MTSSPDRLPPALPSMWRALKLGYRDQPGMMLGSFVLSQIAAIPDALLALWLKLLGDAVLDGNRRLLLLAAFGLGASATATWFLGTLSVRFRKGTPILRELAFDVRHERRGERKVITSGRLHAEGEVFAEAEGTFVVPKSASWSERSQQPE